MWLADEVDTEAAVAAAKRALPAWSATSREERIAALRKLAAAVAAKKDAILDAIVLKYGAPMPRNAFAADSAINTFSDALHTPSVGGHALGLGPGLEQLQRFQTRGGLV